MQNSIVLTIHTDAPVNRSIPLKTGQSLNLIDQRALLSLGNGAVLPCVVSRNPSRGEKLYDPGRYALSPDSYSPGKWGQIDFRPIPGERLSDTAVASSKPSARVA